MQTTTKSTLAVRKRTLVISAALCATLMTSSLKAFKPTAEFGHVGIVSDALTAVTWTLATGDSIKFSDSAVMQVRDATAGVDEIVTARGEFSTPEAHCDNELLPECTKRIVDLKGQVVSLALALNGQEARAQLGRALHTLQDFYSHSNWVNSPGPGNASFNSTLGRGTLAKLPLSSATCIDNLFDGTLTGAGLSSITTGWFGSLEPPSGKCAHGVISGAGIHKDEPGRPFHASARSAAVEGTKDFVRQILTALGSNDAAVRALMGAKGTLGFVIDSTGSMGGVINGVKSVVGQIVASVTATPGDQPDDYLLETFNDPFIGSPLLTANSSELLSAVNGVSASGGGDCPELSQAGLLAAITKARSGSHFYFFSDASAKDSSLGGNVVAEANAKRITLNYILNGSCSPIDPAYIRGAQETGGQLFFVSASEISKLFGLVQPTLTGDLQSILLVNETLTPGPHRYAVPIDSSVRAVTFSVALDTPTSIRVLRPGGIEAAATDFDVKTTSLSTGKIVTVEAPARGAWTLEVIGSGALSASVMANSDLGLDRVEFVERRGREAHEGLFALNGQPVVGDLQVLRARLLGAAGSVRFEATSVSGAPLTVLPLTSGDVDATANEYVGSVVLPPGQFRVYAHGVDSSGLEFVRAYPALFGAQSVRVRAVLDGLHLPLGQTTGVEFAVTNLGAPQSFAVTASDQEGFGLAVSPPLLALATNETGRVVVNVTVPSTATERFDTLTLVAKGVVDPSLSNSARVGAILGVSDGDGDGVPDDRDLCMSSSSAPTIVIGGIDSGVPNQMLGEGCFMLDFIERSAMEAKNHGAFVSAVGSLTNGWMKSGLMSGRSSGAVKSTAAKSRVP